MTQRQLAEAVGVPYQTVQRWESGRSHPRPDHLQRLAAALEVTGDKLLETFGARDRPPTLEELARAQGVRPIREVDDLHTGSWPDDENVDDFIRAVRLWRREGTRLRDL